MSNVWHYTMLVNASSAFSVERVTEIVEQAQTRGFSPFHPDTGRVEVATTDMTPANSNDYLFKDLVSAATVLKSGGYLMLWERGSHIGLAFDPRGEDEAQIIKALRLQDTPSFGRLSISIGAYLFRDDEKDRLAIASNVEGLFTDLCVSQGAVYGFSMDENAFELFASRMRVHQDAKLQRRPSVLFWMNYFTSEHWERIDQHDRLQQLGGRARFLPTGVLVSFYSSPWEVDLGQLYAINEAWRVD